MLKLSPERIQQELVGASSGGGDRARLLAAGCVAMLLAWNCASFYGVGTSVWASPVLLLILLAGSVTANTVLLPARLLSLANIFLILLSLFHLGYYVPVRLGFVRALPYMPPVYGDGAVGVITVFCAAELALELGYLLAGFNRRRARRQPAKQAAQCEWAIAALQAGRAISSVCVVCLLIFMMQAGGATALLRMSYSDLFGFLDAKDSRFAFTCMWYAPIGLLLWRLGVMHTGLTSCRGGSCCWWLAAVVLLGPYLLIGARGPSFLFVIGLMYLQHRYRRPLRPGLMVAALVVLGVAAPVIASYRNLQSADRARGVAQAVVGPRAFLAEIGSTYRPYYGIVEMMQSGQQEFLKGESYRMAAWNLVPNIGAANKGHQGGYYRTNAWFNFRLSPVDSAKGIGIGCSMIAEQYANFGYVGVLLVFVSIGMGLVHLESKAVAGSMAAQAVLAILVVPLCWYIRDDIFGTLRMFIWPLATVVLVRVLRIPLARTASAANATAGNCE